jgi:peptidoglycan/xylan/chitin deacetylase (PgdA/CDA1 family)
MYKVLAITALDVSGIARALAPIYAGRGVIFGGHRVLEDSSPTLVPGNAISASQLERTIRCIWKNGWEIIPLDAVANRLEHPTKQRFACITFDDGFADNWTVAYPILARLGVPFTVFPVIDFVKRTKAPNFELLEWFVLRAERVVLEIPGLLALDAACRTLDEKRCIFSRILPLVWRNEPRLSAALLSAIAGAQLSIDDFFTESFLSLQHLTALSGGQGVSIGSHSMSHRPLSRMPRPEARDELAMSRTWLEAVTGKPVRQVAYPFGSRSDCDHREFSLAAETGYTLGLTTRPGNVYASHSQTLLAIPRVTISMVPHAATDRFIRVSLYGARNALLNRLRRTAP